MVPSPYSALHFVFTKPIACPPPLCYSSLSIKTLQYSQIARASVILGLPGSTDNLCVLGATSKNEPQMKQLTA